MGEICPFSGGATMDGMSMIGKQQRADGSCATCIAGSPEYSPLSWDGRHGAEACAA